MSGFVPPSGLLEKISKDKISAFNKNYNSTPLRMGVVVKIHKASDITSVSKVSPEYDVITSQQNGSMGQSFVRYTNCISIDGFGGVADFFEKKLRVADGEKFTKTYDFNKQNGSLVLMLCADGFTDKGIIIGGFQNTARPTNLPKDGSLHMEGEYNGLNWKVDKDGALTVTFKSKTDNEGKPQDEKAGGSTISIEKDGSIDINDAADELFRMDKTEQTIDLEAKNDITLESAAANINITAGKNIVGKATADIEFTAEGSAKLVSGAGFDIESGGALNIKAPDIIVKADGGIIAKASQVLIDSPLIQLGSGGSPAVTSFTFYLGIGNLGAPVLSAALGPFSSTVIMAF